MKARSETKSSGGRSGEFKGVVKKMTGKLTNNPELEREGHGEMMGAGRGAVKRKGSQTNPDPYRRG